jgi:hypothetical protein
MDAAELTWLNTLILIIVTLLELVVLYGISYQVRKTTDAVERVEETAKEIAEVLRARA